MMPEDNYYGTQGRVSQAMEIKRLIAEIKNESVRFRSLFLTDEEKEERARMASDFEAGMQTQVFSTLKNLEAYRQFGWKELICEGEDSNEPNAQRKK